jgi:hypothetical protein
LNSRRAAGHVENVFVSYSHEDTQWKDRFLQQLRVFMYESGIDPRDDDRIGAGQRWEQEIDSAVQAASAAVLLISSAFLTSKFIREREVPRLLARNESGRLPIGYGSALAQSVIVRPESRDFCSSRPLFRRSTAADAVNPNAKF